MMFTFDKRPDMSITFKDHMGGESQRLGESVAMDVMGHGSQSDSITLHFKTRDEVRAPEATSVPSGKKVDVWVTLDKQMGSLLAAWIFQRVNTGINDRQNIEFEERNGRGDPASLPIIIEV